MQCYNFWVWSEVMQIYKPKFYKLKFTYNSGRTSRKQPRVKHIKILVHLKYNCHLIKSNYLSYSPHAWQIWLEISLIHPFSNPIKAGCRVNSAEYYWLFKDKKKRNISNEQASLFSLRKPNETLSLFSIFWPRQKCSINELNPRVRAGWSCCLIVQVGAVL